MSALSLERLERGRLKLSEFTTQVRYICESYAGLTESGGFLDIDTTIEKSYSKIFGDFPIFDEAFRATLEKEILYQYYMKEICCDSVSLWQYYLTKNLRNIMPYYNQLYKSELLLQGINVLNDVDLKTERDADKQNNSTTAVTGKTTATTENTTNETGNTTQNFSTTGEETQNKGVSTTDTVNNLHWDTHADTPQGTITDLDSGQYMSDARKITDLNTVNRTQSGADTNNSSGSGENNTELENEITNVGSSVSNVTNNSAVNQSGIEKYIEKVSGVRNGSYPEKVMILRKSFLNITAQIINDLSVCFYQFY